MATPLPYTPRGILFGAAYYAEYQQSDRIAEDLDLMASAGFTVIRVGESVWSTWEPRDGEFDLEWLGPVLEGAHARGISVIIGTPTYAVPPWLQRAHPEIAGETSTGVPHAWGARQEIDFSHPTFRHYAERVIRRVIARWATHPAVIGFQVDNEPGMLLPHNRSTFLRFVERLKGQYGDVDRLNREWGLTYWSHRLSDWAELWTPDGNSLPQYDLAWRRYQADLTTEFIAWQAEIVREYSVGTQFVTTCIAYPRPALNDADLVRDLDITAGNPYYAMQDHLQPSIELQALSPWTTSGVWGLLRQADRMFSSKQSRFLVTETNAQSIDGSHNTLPPYPGQLMLAAFAFISRGAAMIEYWHWHTLHFGTETYWGGVLPHSQVPGRVYREVSEIGAALRGIGPRLDGYEPDADVAILYSVDSRFAFDFSPPVSSADGTPTRSSYHLIVDAFYRGVVDAGRQARIVHDSHLSDFSAEDLASAYPVLIVPALYVADDALLRLLRDYATAGGHLVIGIRTGYGDEEARARLDVAPGILRGVAGVSYEEFSNLRAPIPVVADSDSPLELSARAAGTLWADGLRIDGADSTEGQAFPAGSPAVSLAHYQHPEFRRFPAITSSVSVAGSGSSAGRTTVVGTVPNAALAADLARWLAPAPVAGVWAPSSVDITVHSGRSSTGRVWFLHNWSAADASVTTPIRTVDLISGRGTAAGTELTVAARTVLVLGEG